jgi:hypothetical protein
MTFCMVVLSWDAYVVMELEAQVVVAPEAEGL